MKKPKRRRSRNDQADAARATIVTMVLILGAVIGLGVWLR